MPNNMTPQEAIKAIRVYLGEIKPDFVMDVDFLSTDVLQTAVIALRASIPHVLTLSEARALEPHTAIYAQFRDVDIITGPHAVGDALPVGEWPEYGETVRWWNIWPSPELRKATPWKEENR